MTIIRFILVAMTCASALVTSIGAAADAPPPQHQAHAAATAPSLLQHVREITEPFLDVQKAIGYEPFLGCVSGPQEGAMGIHFVNLPFVMDGELNINKPEALIYEPKDGALRLVGVEYILPAAAWDAANPQPPVLEGQVFHFNESPNRFGLEAFYELHVWAWRDNPGGAFADWNTKVSCESR